MLAVKDALYYAREEQHNTDYFCVNSPLTCEKIRESCLDNLNVSNKQ